MLLTDDLQRVGCAHGKKTRITKRHPAVDQIMNSDFFGKDHNHSRSNGTDTCLDTIQSDRVHIPGKVVDYQNLYRKHNSADQHQNIADIDSLCTAEAQ